MLMELNVTAMKRDSPAKVNIDEILRIIDASGLDYRLTEAGMKVEGNWEQLLDLARQCHNAARKETGQVITTIKIEDRGERTERLGPMVKATAKSAGKSTNL